MTEATAEFVEQDMDVLVSYYAENYGVERGPEMLEEFRGVLDKWVDLVQGVETKEELANLYWKEIYSKVDVNAHGMN